MTREAWLARWTGLPLPPSPTRCGDRSGDGRGRELRTWRKIHPTHTSELEKRVPASGGGGERKRGVMQTSMTLYHRAYPAEDIFLESEVQSSLKQINKEFVWIKLRHILHTFNHLTKTIGVQVRPCTTHPCVCGEGGPTVRGRGGPRIWRKEGGGKG